MSIPVLLLTALLAAPVTPQGGANPPAKAQIEESEKKIKELRKERVATLKRVVESSMKLYQNARLDFSEALEDRSALLKAELDAAETDADRVGLCKTALDSLKQYEEVARAKFEAGRESEYAVLKIRARYQEVQIQLEQAKIKQAGGGK